jgi:hypothetical protein
MGRVVSLWLVAVAAAFTFAACNLIQERLSPTEPTSPTATPAPLSIPVILPKASPTPTPTPTPGATPTPTPAPSPTPTPAAPTGGGCGLPPSDNPDAPCMMETYSFLSHVDTAITLVTQQQPGIFDFDDKKCDNCYYVKNPGKFVEGVIANLDAMGLCTYYDGEELAVKNTNSFNDEYDILLASGHLRRGPGSYRSTCRPSWF